MSGQADEISKMENELKQLDYRLSNERGQGSDQALKRLLELETKISRLRKQLRESDK